MPTPIEFVGITEIAALAQVTPNAVNNWVARHPAFPNPLVTLACGSIWHWPDVAEWLVATGRLNHPTNRLRQEASK